MSNDPEVQISAWVKISKTSPIDYDVDRDGEIQFTIGTFNEFMLVTSRDGLQNFVAHANEALRAVQIEIDSNEDYIPS